MSSTFAESFRKKIVEKLLKEGIFIAPDALKKMEENYSEEMVLEVAEIAKKENLSMIEKRHVDLAISIIKGKKGESETFSKEPIAKQVEEKVKIISSYSESKKSTNTIQNKVKYFMSRFEKISSILRQRVDFSRAVDLEYIIKSKEEGPFKSIVIVFDKKRSKLTVEDPTGRLEVLGINDEKVREKISEVVVDSVIGIEILKKNKAFLLTDIVFPDLSEGGVRKSEEDVAALLLSDFHVGSKFFSEKYFYKIINTVKGREYVNEQLAQMMSKVKYVIIAGDLVDGVLIYPGQEKELEIAEVSKQYEKVVSYIREFPDYTTIIVVPGNHDIVRKAIPQPPIDDENILEFKKERKNFYNLSNPCFVSLHDVSFLIFHGQSLEDITSSVPKINYYQPEQSMKYLLKIRHLAPIYGNNTQIALEEEDKLVIEEKPDVFHAGHIHISGLDFYRGTRIINSGTLQEMTPYQEGLGITSTTGSFAIYLLNQGKATILNAKNL
ncbi:MAG: metallophosphoesterase [Candidatus Brockarchaeota archaeon]|nr:metallophosphoesterase [Candidatus Brockarchaeota archaeon]MBO3768455.1 metallophosphoesterase [Candidatus Brockarchaeota archaeon]MBO3801531.1 metallophosphoesterase [Candidatus Brockarchaeota archaeon]